VSAEKPAYMAIVDHYEECLRRHGDTHRGVDWPNPADAARRYDVMLGVTACSPRPPNPLILDFGCGTGHLLEHMQSRGIADVRYAGVDISPEFVAVCRGKFSGVDFRVADILSDGNDLEPADYVIANGVFTEKRSLPWDDMWDYTREMITALYGLARVGLAFNVMSHHVDWEREDLFHLPYDTLAAFLKARISRHFVFRADYGLYEYTTYVFREAN